MNEPYGGADKHGFWFNFFWKIGKGFEDQVVKVVGEDLPGRSGNLKYTLDKEGGPGTFSNVQVVEWESKGITPPIRALIPNRPNTLPLTQIVDKSKGGPPPPDKPWFTMDWTTVTLLIGLAIMFLYIFIFR